jgi:hypothetical protein
MGAARPLHAVKEEAPAIGTRLENGAKVIGTFEDKYEEQRLLLRTRHGIRVQRQRIEGAILFTQAIAPLIAARIKAERKARRWSLLEMARRVGVTTGNPKQRAWALENWRLRRAINSGPCSTP